MNAPTNPNSTTLFFVEAFQRRYEAEAVTLQSLMADATPESGDLTQAVRMLFEHQMQAGVLSDDLHLVERFQLLDPSDPSRAFFFTLNLHRAERHRGRGRTEPPVGWDSLHGNCFLCRENITWQQRFLQFHLPIELSSGRFEAWVNPFPLGCHHLTIASATHRSQRWQAATVAESRAKLLARLGDLVELADRLPGFLVFENGDGAGASIPRHHHYQALSRWPGLDRFPIEEAALATQTAFGSDETLFLLRSYPVSSMVCVGDRTSIIDPATEAVDRWFGVIGEAGLCHVTTNLLAMRNRSDASRIELFIVPRNGHINRSHGSDSHVASLEIAGEMIASDVAARERIQSGRISYRSVWETIASCQDVGSRRTLEKLVGPAA